MKRTKVLITSTVLVVGYFFGLMVVRAQTVIDEKEQKEAHKAWEALIREKGGRQKLESLESFFVSIYSGKSKISTLHVLPNLVWNGIYDLDGEPFASTVDSATSTNVMANERGEIERWKGPVSQDYNDQRIVYLLETKFDKPEPVRISRQRIGKKLYDVLEANFREHIFEFYYEAEEMLVRRVVLYYARGKVLQIYDFDEYEVIDGIEMPAYEDRYDNRIKPGAKYRITFGFNVDYDPELFTRPLKATTPDAWKKRS